MNKRRQQILYLQMKKYKDEQMMKEGAVLHLKNRHNGHVIGSENHNSNSRIFSLGTEIEELQKYSLLNAIPDQSCTLPLSDRELAKIIRGN